MTGYARQYAAAGAVVRYAAGRHGTPGWNPAPHPDAAPDAVARRDTDPLWQDHRGLPDGRPGQPLLGVYPRPYTAMLSHQQRHVKSLPDGRTELLTATLPPPEGLVDWPGHLLGDPVTPDRLLRNEGTVSEDGMRWDRPPGDFHFLRRENRDYGSLFDFNSGGRRPWWRTIFALQDLMSFAAPHDPYGLLAAAVRVGNRHALPPLVDLLRRRDNPAGWYSAWADLAREMDRRRGLEPEDALRRAAAVARETAGLTGDPEAALAHARGAAGDPVGLAAAADRLEDAGWPQYAGLIRAELADLLPQFRPVPRRRGSRL